MIQCCSPMCERFWENAGTPMGCWIVRNIFNKLDWCKAYKILTDMPMSPSGNYSGCGGNKSSAVSEFMSSYEKPDNQIKRMPRKGKLKDIII